MKCPYCQAVSRVIETRGTKRRRECFNDHRFTTVERVVPEGRRVAGAAPLTDRDQQIVKAWQENRTMTQVAKMFGLKTHSQVSRVVARAGLLGGRSHGQSVRWKLKGEAR